ncbi:MAG: NUDIX hydrolase [Micromonosporaceae bacterium]|nr:NUDIX hydrolase [Micromonosporaceae bacterium]
MTYEVRSRVERFRGNVVSLLTDEVVMPGGRTARRDYLVHVGAVGVVAVDEADRVVLVQQYRHPVGDRLWELPAGLIDVDGEELVDAAARELAEEADLTARRWQLLLDVHTTPGCSNEVIRLFLARDLAPVPDADRFQRHDEEAELTCRRFDLDEAVAMALRGELTNASGLVGLFAAVRLRDRGWPQLRPATGVPLPRHPLAPVAVEVAGEQVPGTPVTS